MQYSFLEPASNFPLCQVSLFASHLPLIMKLVWSGSCCFCRESEVGCRKYCWKCSLKFFLRANNIFFSSIILSLVSEKERSHQLSQPNKTLLGTTLKLPYYLTTSEQQGSTCPESVCKHFVHDDETGLIRFLLLLSRIGSQLRKILLNVHIGILSTATKLFFSWIVLGWVAEQNDPTSLL